ncbi:MAG TPA: hypothetical protein VEA99_18215, partial [Gemmatimonadaceae bacterium]|nr:hypothetical protein [Gemmatimonadaceae bacterium]
GLAGMSAVALRATTNAEKANVAALVAQSRMERYRSLSCAQIDLRLPDTQSERTVTVNVAQVAGTATATSRTIRGVFTYQLSTGAAGKPIQETTTILCPQ